MYIHTCIVSTQLLLNQEFYQLDMHSRPRDEANSDTIIIQKQNCTLAIGVYTCTCMTEVEQESLIKSHSLESTKSPIEKYSVRHETPLEVVCFYIHEQSLI